MSQFKAMKFWIEKDVELYDRVVNTLLRLGYTFNSKYEPCNIVVTTSEGKIWNHNYEFTTGYVEEFPEEIDVSWMRTPKKETIELNGKKYLKEDLTNEVGEQLVAALEEALKHLKPVG